MSNQQNQLDRFREAANRAAPPASTVMFEMIALIEGMDSAQVVPNALTRGDLIHLYNSGYHAGHHDTVESAYTDIHQSDMDSYQEEIVDELLEDMAARGES